MTELHRGLAIQGDISMIAELEGLRREDRSVDKLEKTVIEHLIVDLREQKQADPQAKP